MLGVPSLPLVERIVLRILQGFLIFVVDFNRLLAVLSLIPFFKFILLPWKWYRFGLNLFAIRVWNNKIYSIRGLRECPNGFFGGIGAIFLFYSRLRDCY